MWSSDSSCRRSKRCLTLGCQFSSLRMKKFQVYEHLVVARASGMDLFAGIAESRREHELHLRVYILHSRLDDEFAPVDHGEYVGERFKQGVEFAGAEQSGCSGAYGCVPWIPLRRSAPGADRVRGRGQR